MMLGGTWNQVDIQPPVLGRKRPWLLSLVSQEQRGSKHRPVWNRLLASLLIISAKETGRFKYSHFQATAAGGATEHLPAVWWGVGGRGGGGAGPEGKTHSIVKPSDENRVNRLPNHLKVLMAC